MPSHHHWLFYPKHDWVEQTRKSAEPRTPREIISHSIQSYTATMCNRHRNVKGSYWQSETYDHWSRDEEETFRIIEYIEQNPVKAGLVQQPEDWQFSSARLRKELNIAAGEPIP